MGKVRIPVGQTDVTITRSIAREAVKEIRRKTGFTEDSKILFMDQIGGGPRNPRSMFDKCYTKGIRTAYQDFILVEVEEEFTEGGYMRRNKTMYDIPPIFHDKELGIRIIPEYAEAKQTLTIKFRANDLVKLNAWINGMRLTENLSGLLMDVDARYDFSIPYPYLQFLHHAHELREADETVGYGEDLRTYLLTHFRQGVQTRKNMKTTNAHKEVIFQEVHRNTTGKVTEELFYKTREIDRGIYEVAVSFEFRYPRVIGLMLEYPAIIHNKFIDIAFPNAFMTRTEHDGEHLKPVSFIGGAVEYPKNDYVYRGDGGSRMITWDEWFPKEPVGHTQSLSIFPVQVDVLNPNEMFSVYDLTEDILPKACVDYLELYWEDHAEYKESIVNFELYRVGEEENLQLVQVDEDLNLTSSTAMDPRKRNYVRISLLKDLAKINPVTLRALLRNPDVMKPIMMLYDSTTVFTDSMTEWMESMPHEIEPGRNPHIPSLVYSDADNGIDHRSFTLWLKKQRNTNEWFVNLRPNTARQVAVNNITVKR